MKMRWLAAVFVFLAILPAGCGTSTPDSPFEGDWVSETGKRLLFSGSTWRDSDGDSGEFQYTGADPVYTVIFVSNGRTVFQRATFTDETTLELCLVFSDGSVSDCQDLVFDRPTLH